MGRGPSRWHSVTLALASLIVRLATDRNRSVARVEHPVLSEVSRPEPDLGHDGPGRLLPRSDRLAPLASSLSGSTSIQHLWPPTPAIGVLAGRAMVAGGHPYTDGAAPYLGAHGSGRLSAPGLMMISAGMRPAPRSASDAAPVRSSKSTPISKSFEIPSVRPGEQCAEHLFGILDPRQVSSRLQLLDRSQFRPVRPGETLGIMGRNGCGKSTLLKILCGIYIARRPARSESIRGLTPMLEPRRRLEPGVGRCRQRVSDWHADGPVAARRRSAARRDPRPAEVERFTRG